MRITSKGQVTIPQDIRGRLGLLPRTEVEFGISGVSVRPRKASRRGGERDRAAVNALRGAATTRMSAREIMALTRG
jgi:bifunctional DNA-binding transcriptional regulator/antitoxin component of YhaV-PrlF toxin-antitoxin module